MKGIILAGGSGTRLYPLTNVVSKQLLPIYDKPLIYYPLCTLMEAGIKDILIISTPLDTNRFQDLLGNGEQFGINLQYKIQPKPEGLAQAFILGEDFIAGEPCAMILGDNMFHGDNLTEHLKIAVQNANGGIATVFGYYVNDPERFGIVEFDSNMKVISVEEKPKRPKSNYAITGLYFYDSHISEMAKKVKPSDRGELEITDINKMYLENGNLNVVLLDNSFKWLDTGTFDSMYEATVYIKNEQKPIGVPEIIAYRNGWISNDMVKKQFEKYKKSPYSQYLKNILG